MLKTYQLNLRNILYQQIKIIWSKFILNIEKKWQLQIYKKLIRTMINEEEVVNFYETLQDNNLFGDYTIFIYTIFTNAYDKSYPPVSKRLSLYRK